MTKWIVRLILLGVLLVYGMGALQEWPPSHSRGWDTVTLVSQKVWNTVQETWGG